MLERGTLQLLFLRALTMKTTEATSKKTPRALQTLLDHTDPTSKPKPIPVETRMNSSLFDVTHSKTAGPFFSCSTLSSLRDFSTTERLFFLFKIHRRMGICPICFPGSCYCNPNHLLSGLRPVLYGGTRLLTSKMYNSEDYVVSFITSGLYLLFAR